MWSPRCLAGTPVVLVPVLFLSIVSAPPQAAAGTFTLQLENDRIADTDRHYTHGTRISYVSDGLRDEIPWGRDLLQWLYPFDPGANARVGIALGQSIFTPDDIAASELITDDRPYAGWLYVGLSLHVEAKRRLLDIELDSLDTMELNLGVVGPASLAEETQKLVHRIIDVQRPNGWDNQLENEPGVLLVLERKWRPEPARGLGMELDALPHAGISLGNVDTSASAGAIFRIGQGLSVDYGPPHIRPNLTGLAAFDPDQRCTWLPGQVPCAWYLFGGFGGRAVARNIFLDGNTFRSSHSVQKENFVGDAQVGAVAVIDRLRVAATFAFRTREFEGQDQADRFGAISLSVRF